MAGWYGASLRARRAPAIKEAGVFTTVATLVDNLSDNPAAKLTAQEIAERVKLAQAVGA